MPQIKDPDNPEWSAADFAASRSVEALPEAIRSAFPSAPRPDTVVDNIAETVTVSLRLSVDVVDHFKAQGPGWEGRINEALRALIS